MEIDNIIDKIEKFETEIESDINLYYSGIEDYINDILRKYYPYELLPD